jgi:Ni/Co efflux regulator RcnB
MKSTTLALALFASLSFGNLALAQGHDRHGSNDERPTSHQKANSHDQQRGNHSGHGDRYDPRFDQRNERWNDRRAEYNARGPEFRRGGHIPREYHNPTYVINDYRAHHLPAPPQHQHWVQVGSDYVLVAIATGIIASIVLNH